MNRLLDFFEQFGRATLLLWRALSHLGSLPRQWERLVDQCYFIGYTTFPIVGILSFFIGSVLALQTGYSLQGFGAQNFIGAVVGLSMARELGPVMTAILVAGRVGSSITAELASMKVNQEVDALRTMNIPPERILVLPRLAAIFIVMPVLTLLANIIGWLGGAVVAEYVDVVGIGSDVYFQGLRNVVTFGDVFDGIIKAQVFGLCVILVACHVGLQASGGPREVGRAVTRSVVLSLILILVLDYFVTRALM
ncbi:MAG: ABC transporter permease [Puniceicoccaceae bacterium]|nr:MAG: ABC transporter permease [Puniceicoccaceae bacterium]